MSARDPQLERRAFELLDELFELPSDRREQRLALLAQADPALGARLRALLAADQAAQSDTFLSGGVAADIADREKANTPDPGLVGQSFGPWRVMEPLGAGGMGQVWLAERTDSLYRGKAAIKLLGRGAFASSTRARFVREGEILGRLSHPNIARLLDAGVAANGERYLVLEYIDGLRIDHYCDQRRLTLNERVELFRKVCAAVAHAHRNLIVHRDLKPSNVLVTAEGEVKLLDFGIAKLLEPDPETAAISADAHTMASPDLTEMAGTALTPEYAAPEQILGTGVTTRTDVYSLGVMLYVLLAGEHPYVVPSTAPALRLQAAVNTEPRRGSDTVTRAGVKVDQIAANRRLNPRKLRELLRGDLDNILARALKKPPDERYASAEDLSRDLERYLSHQPVEARPDSLGYRARKFLRRNRLAVAATGVVTLSLLGGLGLAVWQAGVAREQARIAQSEAAKANAVKNFILDMFLANDLNAGGGGARGDTTVAQLLDIGVNRMAAGGLQSQPEVRAELLDQLGILNLQIQSADKSERMFRALRDVRLQQFGANDPRTIDTWTHIGNALRNQNKYEQALGYYQRVLDELQANRLNAPIVRGRALLEMSYVLFRTKPNDLRGIESAEEALRLLQPLKNDEKLYMAQFALGRAYEAAGRSRDAIRSYSDGIIEAGKLQSPDSTGVAGGTQMRGRTRMARGEFTLAERDLAAAEQMFRERVGVDHRYFHDASAEHAEALDRLGRWREAEAPLRAQIEFVSRTRSPDHSLANRARISLGRLLENAGDPRGAIEQVMPLTKFPDLTRKRPDIVYSAWLAVATSWLSLNDAARGEQALRQARFLLPAVQDFLREMPDELRALTARFELTQGDVARLRGDAPVLDSANARAAQSLGQLGEDWQGNRDLFWRLRLSQARLSATRDPTQAIGQLESLLAEVRKHPEHAAYQHLEANVALELGLRQRAAGREAAACQSLRSAAALRRNLLKPGSERLRETAATVKTCL